MFKHIIFHNCAHLGDVFVSKGFVKWIVDNIYVDNYTYYHNGDSNLLKDLKKIKIMKYDRSMYINKWKVIDDVLYANTWYRACHDKYHNGTNIHTLFNLFKNELKNLNVDLPGAAKDYIPEINYNKFNTQPSDKFLESIAAKKKIFICNNITLSGQADNFDFDPIIIKLADKYKRHYFILSNMSNVNRPNVFYTQNVMGVTGSDLNENAYIAGKCDLIIGRGSGPYTYCFNKDTMNKSMKMLSFSCESSTNFGLQEYWPDKFLYGGVTSDARRIFKTIENKLERLYE